MRYLPGKRVFLLLPVVTALAACSVGPDYIRPQVAPIPAQFKEMQGWKPAQPQNINANSKWWEMFADAQLNALVEQIDISNQNIAQYEANFRKAMALVDSARANYGPTVTASYGETRTGSYDVKEIPATRRRPASFTATSNEATSYNAGITANWSIDIWGNVRRSVESNEAGFQASAADLAAARLSAQAQLVQNYLQLRVIDAQQKLLQDTVTAYERSHALTQNQYKAGTVSMADVIQARSQWKTAQAQALDNGVQRAQLEHAIALLVGKTASAFNIAPAPLMLTAPPIPQTLPSQLLERRPDIAAAERRVAAANAQIGVAQVPYYPSLDLSATLSYANPNLAGLLDWPRRAWALGAQFGQVLFDSGIQSAAISQVVASYDATVAAYRQSVLTAFQEVEDNLASLRILEEEAAVQKEALDAARMALTIVNHQYKNGTVSYVNVITAQNAALASERSALDILNRRMAASVLLIKALGGSWNEGNIADMKTLIEQGEQSKKRKE